MTSAATTTEASPEARAIAKARSAVFFGLLSICVAAALAYALVAAKLRPVDGAEGHVFYEALRMQAHKTIYVDPRIGTTDDGLPPGRVYALYTPVMAVIASLFPASLITIGSRLFATTIWYGVLAWLAASAKRAGANVQLAWGAAAFVGGTYVLTIYGTSGRPDTLAVVLAAVAFARSLRAGKCTAVEGALFALAAWVKPNVFGLAIGTLAVDFLRKKELRLTTRALPIAAAAAVTAAMGGTLMLVSHGAFLQHLTEAIKAQQTFSLAWQQVSSRLPFFGGAIALALALAYRRRDVAPDSSALALGGMGVSILWTFFSLSKFGSASNYWMETCVGLVAIAASLPFALSELRPRDRWLVTGFAFLQLIWMGVGSVRSSIEAIQGAPAAYAEIVHARELCGAKPDETVMADDSGLELMIDGRLFQAPVQLTPLVKYGRWSEEMFLSDVRDPRVTCAVMSSDLLERPLDVVDPDHDLYDPTLRAALRDRFALVDAHGGFWVYALRSRRTR